jgi:hypothetical protein
MTSKKAQANATAGAIWAALAVWWLRYEYPLPWPEGFPSLAVSFCVGMVTYTLLLAISHRDESS